MEDVIVAVKYKVRRSISDPVLYTLDTLDTSKQETAEKGGNTFDVIKHSQWMLNTACRIRRLGLPEDQLRKDFEQIQEKILLEEVCPTYWCGK